MTNEIKARNKYLELLKKHFKENPLVDFKFHSRSQSNPKKKAHIVQISRRYRLLWDSYTHGTYIKRIHGEL